MSSEFNFPTNAFGYVPGTIPAKIIYASTAPTNPVEALFWMNTAPGELQGTLSIRTSIVDDTPAWVTLNSEGLLRAQLELLTSTVPIAGVPAKETSQMGFFADGIVLRRKNHLVIAADGQAWFWRGTLPKTVAAGTTPEASGGIGIDKWTKVVTAFETGNFQTGFTATTPTQFYIWPSSIGGDNKRYVWQGTFPKIVPANSSPASTGGVGDNAWLSLDYLADALADGSAVVGGGRATVTIPYLKKLGDITPATDVIYLVKSTIQGYFLGSGFFVYDPNRPKADHDGVVCIAKEALQVWNGTPATFKTFADLVLSGTGCYVRLFLESMELSPEMAGSLGISNDQIANQVICEVSAATGYQVKINKNTILVSTLQVPSGAYLDCIEPYGFLAAAGFAVLTPVLKFGDSATQSRWIGRGGDLIVHCGNQRVIGIQFSYPWEHAIFDHLLVNKCAYIPVQTIAGFGVKLISIDATAPSVRAGDPENAQVDSLGVDWRMSDSFITGAVKTVGYFVGFKATGSNNKFNGVHPYGLYEKDGIPQTCPMGVGIWNEGQGNRFTNSIADSPSKIDYSLPASLTNGGYGTVNRGNAYQSSFDGITVFVPDRTVFGETIPTGLKAHYCDQLVSFTNAETNDQTNVSLDEVNPLVGPDALLCRYDGLERQQIYCRNAPIHLVKPYFKHGIEFNATYQDADNFPSGFGSCSFSLLSRAFLTLNNNYEGNISQIKMERTQQGNASVQSFLASIFGANEIGYRFFRTDAKKARVFNGTEFKDPDGGLTFFYPYTVPGLAANGVSSVNLTAVGVVANWISNVTFNQPHGDVHIWAVSGSDSVTIYFKNLTNSPVSASSAGTLGVHCYPII